MSISNAALPRKKLNIGCAELAKRINRQVSTSTLPALPPFLVVVVDALRSSAHPIQVAKPHDSLDKVILIRVGMYGA